MNKSEKNTGHTNQSPSEHHKMPDGIWMQQSYDKNHFDTWCIDLIHEDDVPYTRTDLYEQVKAERDLLRAVISLDNPFTPNQVCEPLEKTKGKDHD